MIRSGQLKDKIIINRETDAQNEYGGLSNNLVKVFSTKANVKVLSATELLKAGVELTNEYISIKMRYDKRLQYEHSINYEGNNYEVESIRPDDRKRSMIVVAHREIV